MKKIILIVLLGLSACGRHHVVVEPSQPCTVSKIGTITTITCPDGTTSSVNDGATGAQGTSGSQGYSIGMFTSTATLQECPNGGMNLIFFEDKNNNDVYVAGEEVTTVMQVCNGLNGTNGTSSIISVSQASVAQCANGGLVFNTENGNVNQSNIVCNGATGPQGQQGPSGVDLSSVSVVQFCSGYQTSYPNSFPEFGMCVNGNLYAVYWNGSDAWLAEIVSGYYASTSTSAPCNFTVTSGCNVTN